MKGFEDGIKNPKLQPNFLEMKGNQDAIFQPQSEAISRLEDVGAEIVTFRRVCGENEGDREGGAVMCVAGGG